MDLHLNFGGGLIGARVRFCTPHDDQVDLRQFCSKNECYKLMHG